MRRVLDAFNNSGKTWFIKNRIEYLRKNSVEKIYFYIFLFFTIFQYNLETERHSLSSPMALGLGERLRRVLDTWERSESGFPKRQNNLPFPRHSLSGAYQFIVLLLSIASPISMRLRNPNRKREDEDSISPSLSGLLTSSYSLFPVAAIYSL